MKIIFFTRRFFPLIGGVEKHCLEVGRRLIKNGHEVTVITEGKGGLEVTEGIRVYRIPITMNEKLKKFQIWFWLFRNRKLIEESDIIHCHDVFFWYLPFRLLYPNKKVFTTFHGWEGVYPPSKKSVRVRKLSEKLSRGNICVGDYISKWYRTKPDYVIYGGVDRLEEEQKKPVGQPELKIVFIGRLEKDTGLPIYLEVLNELKKRKVEYEIIFVGDGSLRCQVGIYGKILGFVKNIYPSIYKARCVFTSSYLVSLEAMYLKRRVFSVFDNPLKGDILVMTPFSEWITINGNPVTLAKKIIYYLNHPEEEKEIVEKAYKWAVQQTWDKVVDVYLKLWQK